MTSGVQGSEVQGSKVQGSEFGIRGSEVRLYDFVKTCKVDDLPV